MKTILLLHGMGGPNPLNAIEKDLQQYMNVMKPIMPGFQEDDGIIEYQDEDYVEYVEQIRKENELEDFIVLGYSMGGRTALNYTIKYPHRVKQLILLDSAGIDYIIPPLKFSWGKKMMKTVLTPMLKFSFVQELLGRSDFVDHHSEDYKLGKQWVADMMKSRVVRKNFVEILTSIGKPIQDLENKIKELHVPTLVLWAKDDKTTSVTNAYWLEERLENSQLHILPGYRHMAPIEKSDFYIEHIRKYIEGTE